MSCLDAAAKVLTEEGVALSCADIFDLMDTRGYWKSANGKTPSNTLYSAIVREIKDKGNNSRFRKTDRGKFRIQSTKGK